jgi:hypothetical protein
MPVTGIALPYLTLPYIEDGTRTLLKDVSYKTTWRHILEDITTAEAGG